MLRGLAFRLRPGAEGVVLVKPQFELPDRRVKAEDADPARLRQAAVDKVRERARKLGFELVGQFDSPVAGGSGTVEVLAHLRFGGRPDSMPKPGERKRAAEPRAAATPAATTLRWFAVVAPGLEEVARAEIAALPEVSDVEAETGGVSWTGPLTSGYRANLWSRITTRVLARAGEVEAREFGKLRRRAARLPWPSFVAPGATVAVRASATHCRLYHTGALAEAAALAVADAVPGARAAKRGEEEAADVTLLVRGVDDRFMFSADASGELLHRRGARVEIGAAPLRETLAAGLLALAGWRPGTALVDPMCGAGTIVIEAAMQALGRAPGAGRAFAMERWPSAKDAALAALRAEVGTGAGDASDLPIVGSDRDARTIESARRNAERAGVTARLTLACRDADAARPPAPTGLVITNPPYGHRLGDARAAARGYRDLGRVLRTHFRGWRAAVVTPAKIEAERQLSIRSSGATRFPLRNGGLAIVLHVFDLV
jgi:putative N6-adenine-specific DNA methylase